MRSLSYISDRYVFALEKRATSVPLKIMSTERSLEVFPHSVRYHVSESSAQCQNVKLLTKTAEWRQIGRNLLAAGTWHRLECIPAWDSAGPRCNAAARLG